MSAETFPNQQETAWPTVYGELTQSTDYANEAVFSTPRLIEAFQHYHGMLDLPYVGNEQQQNIETILSRIEFELRMRDQEAAAVSVRQ